MKRHFKRSLLALAVSALLASPTVYATNGYFKIGYGAKTRGMGGAGVAFPQDSIAAATNPAGLSWVGNRADLGAELFSPLRDARLDARFIGGADTGDVDSGATLFLIPNAGFVMNLADMTMGLTMYANGGMNTRYNSNVFDMALAPAAGAPVGAIPNTGTLGVNLAQLIIAPSVSAKLGENHSVGGSLLIGYQRFRAYGLGDFAAFGFSSDPADLTNRSDDDAWGAGLRVGWMGNLSDSISVGAAAASKIYMQKFKRYEGLFAEDGDFDIPANFAVGIAFKPTQKATVAFDVQRILYEGVASVSNAGPTGTEFSDPFLGNPVSRPLGTDNGFGFGWNDMTIYKLGINYDYSDSWTFRGGFNYGKSPIDDDQNLFNILAPGIVEKHLTLGFTYQPARNNELTVTYMHAFRKDQSFTYDPSANLGPGTSYTAEIGMSQNAIEASYAWKF